MDEVPASQRACNSNPGRLATHYSTYLFFSVPSTVLGPGNPAATETEQGTDSLGGHGAHLNPGLYYFPKATGSFQREISLPGSLGSTVGLRPIGTPREEVVCSKDQVLSGCWKPLN